ncbi:MAG: hypothetical protein WA197_26540 [Candidatus Acidiferrales bacterium]
MTLYEHSDRTCGCPCGHEKDCEACGFLAPWDVDEPELYAAALRIGSESPVCREMAEKGVSVDRDSVPPSCRAHLGLMGLLK